MNLLNIKRLAYERRPVNRADGTAEPARARDEAYAAPHLPASQAPHPPDVSPAASPVRTSLDDRAEIARLVQRFMGAVNKPAAAPSPSAQPASAPGGTASNPRGADGAAPRPVDFVSEDDVRTALKMGEKIYVGPRTIITPSAHDLGDPSEVFVKAP